ncbi:hypothetical protein HD806DRAFT_277353 [Xylariaceae sp. AK1471]|nr:hypothetical protein HD806DRAFT_277353 [Xylariaceae sp. AK1471]
MAYTQHVAGKHQSRHRRHTSSSETHDWEPRREESRHSLPYRVRARQPEIQRPEGRRPKYSSSHRSRPSEDFLVVRSMPSQAQLLARSATTKSRSRPAYDEDDDDDDEDNEKERLRGRMQSRSRSRAKIRPSSQSSQSSESTTIPTPTRSSYMHHRSAPPSVPSLGSASESSSGDSESSDSTQDHRMKPRSLKERMNGTPDSEPAPTPTDRSRSKGRPRSRIVPEVESASEHSEDKSPPHRPRVVVKRSSPSRRRHRHQSRAPSGTPQNHSGRHGQHSEEHTSSPKRYVDVMWFIDIINDQFCSSPSKRYYHSDISYSENPFLSRPSSRVPSSHSLSSSSKRSSPFNDNFFHTSAPPQHHDKGSKM